MTFSTPEVASALAFIRDLPESEIKAAVEEKIGRFLSKENKKPGKVKRAKKK
jgi:hypothetical protein